MKSGKAGQGVPGFEFYESAAGEYGQSRIVRVNPQHQWFVFSEDVVDTGLPIGFGRGSLSVGESDDEVVLPLAHEKKFPEMIVADGKDPRDRVAGFSERSYLESKEDRHSEIQRFPRGRERFRAVSDPVSAEPQSPLIR